MGRSSDICPFIFQWEWDTRNKTSFEFLLLLIIFGLSIKIHAAECGYSPIYIYSFISFYAHHLEYVYYYLTPSPLLATFVFGR